MGREDCLDEHVPQGTLPRVGGLPQDQDRWTNGQSQRLWLTDSTAPP